MRTSIVGWSVVGGLVLGLFIDVVLAGAVAITVSAIPGLMGRVVPRWIWIWCAVVLAAIPLASAALGFIEGRLKLS